MNSLRAVGARAITMMISMVCGIITTRMIIGGPGVEYYALYTLLITIPTLLTFTDLGSGAVLVNSVATSDDVRTDPHVRIQLTTVVRVILTFSAVAMALNAVLLVSGSWEAMFGHAGELPGASLAAFYCLTIFCVSAPVSIWSRIMLGQRKNHIVILLQGLISPLTMSGVWLMLQFGGAHIQSYLGIASFAASLVVAVLGLSMTTRMTRPLVSAALRMVPNPRRYPGIKVMDVGWPMLAQTLTYPIAVGSQRYVLAQFGTPYDVAEYGVVGQVFFALNALVLAAGLALWPHFARSRDRGELTRGPFGLSAMFAGAVAVATAAVLLVSPWLFGFITQGELEVRASTVLAFGAMITMTAAVYPLGMFIMDKPGIKFQVVPTLSMAAVGVTLGIILAPVIGVTGPLLSVAVALVLCQLIPFSLYIRRHRDRLMSNSPSANAAESESV